MDHWSLRADPGRFSDAQRQSGRRVRPKETVRVRNRPVHHSLARRGPSPLLPPSSHCEGGSRRGSRHIHSDSVCNPNLMFSRGKGEKQGPGNLHLGALRRLRSRLHTRRCSHGNLRLEVDNVRERPYRSRGAILSQKFLADNPGRSTERHLDLPGAVSLTGGLILFVYALTIASIDGFTSIDTLVPLGLSGLILAGFLAIENRSRAPLIPLSFLRRGNVLSANAMGLIFTSSAGGLTFLLTVFLQQILKFSAPAAGIAFLPPALIFFFVGGWGSSWLTNRIGMKPVLILSMALVTIGSALLIPITVAGGYFGILPGLIVWSLGASIGFVALSIAAVAGTQRGEEGLASGLINTSERIGFPLGLAVLLTIATITDPTPVGASGPSLASLLIGFQYAFLAATVLNGIGLLIALLIKNEKATNQY